LVATSSPGAKQNVFVKLSEVTIARIELAGGPTFNQETLGALWDLFGEDHVLYASDWPNSDHHATYAETFAILHDFAKSKSRQAEEKFFWKNSVAAYRWHRRQPDQPMLQEKV
jgi:L-fucono-1,5-lactonase